MQSFPFSFKKGLTVSKLKAILETLPEHAYVCFYDDEYSIYREIQNIEIHPVDSEANETHFQVDTLELKTY